MKLNDTERQLVLTALELKRETILAELHEIDQLIDKTKNNVVTDNNVVINKNRKRRTRDSNLKDTTWSKIEDLLFDNGNSMTSRDILKELYKEYPIEFDQAEDRKNIAIISSILYEKVNEGMVDKEKNDREQTRFKLKNNLDSELDAFEKRMGIK
jgi:hypothetical protein